MNVHDEFYNFVSTQVDGVALQHAQTQAARRCWN
jgi:hypothetical protein